MKKYYSLQFPLVQGEKRFAFLQATGFFEVERSNKLRLFNYGDYVLNHNRDIQIEAIKSLDCFFEKFNRCNDITQVCDVLASGDWASYFDACKTLSSEAVVKIAGEILMTQTIFLPKPPVESTTPLQPSLLPQPRKIKRGDIHSSTL